MQLRCLSLHILSLLIVIYTIDAIHSVSTICEFNVTKDNKLYSYNLASPSETFTHGVLSEDGYFLLHMFISRYYSVDLIMIGYLISV
ncbi:hypothetical protein HanXRQr2_Chr08g0334901 [Helianthus annuus]|uniref:Uncharacterized protein n=1 Tax=Helianthus annuus TaxID=4232 RepID=A0A9K3ND22_HELAN|nr:hypothetical protein HanXRQr2_Chr08g0334901 [Helianthus annuus]